MCNLWPLRIAGRGDEEIRFVVFPYRLLHSESVGVDILGFQ